MPNHLININQNGTTTLATAGKYCDRDVDVVVDVANSGGELPEEAFNITGVGSYRFAYNGWNWFIEQYGNKCSVNLTNDMAGMFSYSDRLTSIPFEINNSTSGTISVIRMFAGCFNLEELPKITFTNSSHKINNVFCSANKAQNLGYI